MKKVILLIVATSALILTSCMSMIVKNTIKDTPITNRIVLHNNVRQGDYAVYRTLTDIGDPQLETVTGETTVRIEVESVNGNEIHIKQTTNSTGMSGMFVNNIVFNMITDKDGNVKSASYTDGEEIVPLKIAQPGDDIYNEYQKVNKSDHKKWNIPENITVPAGTFKVDAMYYNDKKYEDKNDIFYMGTKKVNFYHVATMITDEDTRELKKITELIEQGTK